MQYTYPPTTMPKLQLSYKTTTIQNHMKLEECKSYNQEYKK